MEPGTPLSNVTIMIRLDIPRLYANVLVLLDVGCRPYAKRSELLGASRSFAKLPILPDASRSFVYELLDGPRPSAKHSSLCSHLEALKSCAYYREVSIGKIKNLHKHAHTDGSHLSPSHEES